MPFFRRILALCAAFLPLVSFAQTNQPLPKTLLWRITGHGLQKPSYLFGTIHLADKGLFNFGDSLYAAIEHTQGLAIELNPDEMIAYAINQAVDNADSKLLKDELGENEFRHYAPALSKRLHKKAEDITSRDIVHEKNRWMSDFLAKGEMPTFVDAYLYTMAKRQGKLVGGIEDLADQTGIINTLYDKSDLDELTADSSAKSTRRFSLTKLLRLYVDQDISAIGTAMNGFDSTQRDALLTKRNIKMARRMDSLSAIRSTFFAVGVAHLPGNDGVIALLRKRGFTIEPVFSSRKIPADQYKYESVPVAWHEVTDVDSLYTASMPGIPLDLKLYGFLNMKFMFDLSDMTGYCIMAFAGASKSKNIDTLGANMAESMFGKYNRTVTKKHVNKDGLEGIQLTGDKKDFLARVQLFNRDNILYVAFVIARKEAMLHTADAEKFLKSFTLRTPPARKQKSEMLTDTRYGISVTTPVHMNLTKKGKNGTGWDYTTYIGMDAPSELAIVVTCKATDAGHYIAADSSLLQDLKTMMTGDSIITRHVVTADGHPAYEIEGHEKNGNGMRILSVTRGNKHITVCLISNDGQLHSTRADSIFSSFRFRPYQEMGWSTATTADGGYRVWAPQDFDWAKDDKTHTIQYSFDSLTTMSYFIETDSLNDYAWSASDTAYYYGRIRNYAGINPIISVKPIRQGSYNGAEAWVKRMASGSYSRVRVIRFGRTVCVMMGTGEKEVLEGRDASKLFTSLMPIYAPGPFNLSASKSKSLIDNLSSTDSATRGRAMAELTDLAFSKADLPLWHHALYQRYAPKWGDSFYVNQRIGRLIATQRENSTLDYIKANAGIAASMPAITAEMLAAIHTGPAYEMLAQFLVLHPDVLNYRTLSLMKDSLQLLSIIMPRMLPLAADTTIAHYLADMVLTLKDSGLMNMPVLMTYQPRFIAAVMKVVPTRQQSDYNPYPFYSLPKLLSSFNTPTSLNALATLATAKDKYLRKTTVVELVKNGRHVDTALLISLAADPTTRGALYNELKESGHESLYPRLYYRQKYFAETNILATASDDEEEPTTVKQVGERISVIGGLRYKFYLYKVAYEEDPERTYLGIAGAYDASGKDLDPEEAYTGIYWVKPYDGAKVDVYFKAFLAAKKEENAATVLQE